MPHRVVIATIVGSQENYAAKYFRPPKLTHFTVQIRTERVFDEICVLGLGNNVHECRRSASNSK
jgi:hypothetical protein